jgi:hypothetical protein
MNDFLEPSIIEETKKMDGSEEKISVSQPDILTKLVKMDGSEARKSGFEPS